MEPIINVGPVPEYPKVFDEADWDNSIGIQRKTELTIFRDCDTIPLIWQYAKGKPHIVAQKRDYFYDKYFDKNWFWWLEARLLQYYTYGHIISALFARLKPNGELKPHVDGGMSVVHNHNIHVPITTNEDCLFTVGEKTKHLEVGKIYEVDNTVTHSVVNGDTPRIHLILEWYNPAKVKGHYDTVESVHGDGRIYKVWRKK